MLDGFAILHQVKTKGKAIPVAVSKYFSEIGFKGGKARSEKKLKAIRQNALKPCAPGKHRGRPKGSPNKSTNGNGFQAIHE